MQTTELTSNAPLEVPSWHLEFPLRWPQITYAKPATFRLYPPRQLAAIPMKKRAPILPVKTKRKRKTRRRARRRLIRAQKSPLPDDSSSLCSAP